MDGIMKKYEEAFSFHVAVYEDLMVNHPEIAERWQNDLNKQLWAVIMVASYDDEVMPEQIEELHNRREVLIYGHTL